VKNLYGIPLFLLAGILALFSYCEANTQREQLIRHTVVNDTVLISISTASGWLLDVYAAGDGVLKYRSKALDSYHFGENTFEFDSLRGQLIKRLQQVDFQRPPLLGVRIVTSQQPSGRFFALQDEWVARDLFNKAFHAGILAVNKERRASRLKKMYKIYPPIPKK